jgi:hypothetical protein
MSTIKIIAGIGAIALSGVTHAATQQQAGHFGFVAAGTAEFGGDTVGYVKFTNGDTQNIKAGQGVGLHIGGHYRFAGSPFDLSATVGFKYVTTAASNADIKLTRTVLEVLGTYYMNDYWWLSAGAVQHRNIKLDLDGYLPNAKFDDATGATVKVGWRWIGVQYTNIKYKVNAPYIGSSDASNFGVVLVGRF